jgi:mRNA interferase RelE/StbE
VLRLAPDVQQAIRSLHPELKRRVRDALDGLLTTPAAGKMLRRELFGWRSLRVGRVRIIYREKGAVIDVAAIGPRASIYFDAAARLRRRT